MKNCNRTESEIADKIKELISNSDNFTYDSDSIDIDGNLCASTYFSEYATENTLNQFVNWLFEK